VNPNSNLLMVGTVALVPPTLSFAILLVVMPYSVASLQAMPDDPDFFRLSISVDQQKELQQIHVETQPRILAVLTPTQRTQMDTTLAQGQLLWQGLAILDLSEAQQSEIRGIIKSQRLKIFKQLTPDQRRQLGRSLPTPLL
jgi:uncharacterized membrane protein